VVFIGMGRIYCGTLKNSDIINIFDDNMNLTRVNGYKLFHFMGKYLEPLSCIPSGNIFGIGGIHDQTNKKNCFVTNNELNIAPTLHNISNMSYPIVRVSIDPTSYKNMKRLELGLKLLNKIDTGIEVILQSNGEYILCASGELHLQRCIRDLTDTFAKDIELNISEPIVSFKETICEVTNQELQFRLMEYKKQNGNDSSNNGI